MAFYFEVMADKKDTKASKRESLWDPVTAEDREKLEQVLAPFADVDVDVVVKEGLEKQKAYNKQLRESARTPEQLTVGIECKVIDANFYQQGTSHTPRSEMRIGGNSPVYRTGDIYHLELIVDSNSPLKKITFNGWPHIEVGDLIKAYMIQGEYKFEKELFSEPVYHKSHTTPKQLVPRELKEHEFPFKLEKLRDGLVVARYHGVTAIPYDEADKQHK